DRDTGRYGWDQYLRRTVPALARDQKVFRLGRRLHRTRRPVDQEVGAVPADLDGRGIPWSPGRDTHAAGGHRRPGEQFAECGGLGRALLARERGGDDVGVQKRPRRGMAAKLEGHEREVDQTLSAEISASVFLADQERGPAEFGAGGPIGRIIASGI